MPLTGHTGFRMASGEDSLLLWTDTVHMPDVQVARPEVPIAFDADPDQAKATRLKLLDEVAAERTIVGGMHLNMPGFMVVERHGTGYAKVDRPWTPALQ